MRLPVGVRGRIRGARGRDLVHVSAGPSKQVESPIFQSRTRIGVRVGIPHQDVMAAVPGGACGEISGERPGAIAVILRYLVLVSPGETCLDAHRPNSPACCSQGY
jgi:hypothetical protein